MQKMKDVTKRILKINNSWPELFNFQNALFMARII